MNAASDEEYEEFEELEWFAPGWDWPWLPVIDIPRGDTSSEESEEESEDSDRFGPDWPWLPSLPVLDILRAASDEESEEFGGFGPNWLWLPSLPVLDILRAASDEEFEWFGPDRLWLPSLPVLDIPRDTLDMGRGLMSRRCYFQLVSAASSPDNSRILKNDLYGIVKQQSGSNSYARPEVGNSMAALLRERECGMPFRGIFTRGDKCRISSRLLPNIKVDTQHYPSKAFCGTFARNGDIFMTACQDSVIRIYDTSQGDFKQFKSVSARDVGWSILDMAVSPDGLYFVYSSWSEYLHLCNVFGDHQVHQALPLCPEDRRFCIFSLQFSCDGGDILGGANDSCLYVFDREAHHRSLRIRAHDGDVNSVAFADKTSQILFSGGDDGLCKVWDRRTLSERDPKPVGILAGHSNGITFVDSKNDARYLITNSKDQTIKLWDMRAFSSKEAIQATRTAVACQNWDYRWQRVPKKLLEICEKLPGDTSLMTYHGHTVLQTLIRCHFSPAATTGQQFIYTGCASGRVVVYDLLTGKVATVLSGHRSCVRDVSWHPYLPVLVSSSWDGSVCKWDYNSEPENKCGSKGKIWEEENCERQPRN